MKRQKVISLLLSAVMITGILAGCGNSSAGNTSTENTSEEKTETEVTEEATGEEVAESDLSGELTIWTTGNELGMFVDGFNEKYPDVKVNIEVTPNADFMAKLTPALASGQGVPDIFTGESDYVKYLVESGYWDDLNSEQYDIGDSVSDMWDYIVSVGTDNSGVLRALSFQASPGSVIYRRDIAEQYLGVSEPDDVSALLSSDEQMMSVAATLKENGIKMFASWQDLLNMEFSNRKNPWVVDGKLNIDDTMLNFMDMAKEIHDNGYDLNAVTWDPEWTAAVESNDTFCYVLPTWGYQFVVKAFADTTKGNWGLAEGPVSYVKGGTWVGIYKDSPNKDLAAAFLKYVCCDTDAQIKYASETGQYMSLKSADEAMAKEPGEEVLGGQNQYEFYNGVMSRVGDDLMTGYDGTINNAFLSATDLYIQGTLDKDAAIQQFKNDVLNAYPELEVD